MLIKRLFDRVGFAPEAHARLRAEAAILQGQLRGATSKVAAEQILGAFKAKQTELRDATPAVIGVAVWSTGASPEQNFSPGLLARGQSEGWLERKGDRIVLHGSTERVPDPARPDVRELVPEADYVYDVLREPGYYCCHCGEELPDAGARTEWLGEPTTEGRVHVLQLHGDGPSPDKNNPSGYRRDEFVAARLVERKGA